MKGFRVSLLCAAASVAGVGVAGAVDIPTHFRGVACILTINAACEPLGWHVGDCAAARYTPVEFGPEGSKVSFIWGFFAQNFTSVAGSAVGTTFKQARYTSVGNSGSVQGAYMRIVSQSPANPSGATFYSHTGDISRFDATCNIRYRFTGQKYPVTATGSEPAAAESLPPFEATTGLSNGGASLTRP